MFEEIGVFERIGEGTDVVSKEMYDFEDKGGRHIALRPEGTASAVRAYVEHRPTPPWKVWYAAPSFRYESPQAGRYRQHHQLGAEAIGSADPDLDVEIVALAWDFLTVGVDGLTLVINSSASPTRERPTSSRCVTTCGVARLSWLPDREKVEAHPMRVLDSKRAESGVVVAEAPMLADHLSPEAKAHFDRVQEGLTGLGIPFTVEPRLVRGSTTSTHPVRDAGAPSGAARHGRGWRSLRRPGRGARWTGRAGVGFALGIERLLAALGAGDSAVRVGSSWSTWPGVEAARGSRRAAGPASGRTRAATGGR